MVAAKANDPDGIEGDSRGTVRMKSRNLSWYQCREPVAIHQRAFEAPAKLW